jgi:hypothetical protein
MRKLNAKNFREIIHFHSKHVWSAATHIHTFTHTYTASLHEKALQILQWNLTEFSGIVYFIRFYCPFEMILRNKKEKEEEEVKLVYPKMTANKNTKMLLLLLLLLRGNVPHSLSLNSTQC